MARRKLTKRARDAMQQEAVRRQQSQMAPGKEMWMIESTKRHGNFKGRDIKIKLLLLQTFHKKQVKKDGRVVREMIVRRHAVFTPRKKKIVL